MYKMILADDELVILKSMSKIIEWTKYGFMVCGVAESGEEVLEKIPSLNPDLIITDVMMPRLNGIELAKKIRDKYPNIEVAVLSGYDEFDYAQSAIRAGVVEYLTKPMKKEELIAALDRVKNRLDRKKILSENMENLKKEVQKQIPIVKNQYFCGLINGVNESESMILGKIKNFGCKLQGYPYLLCAFELDYRIDESYDVCKHEMLWVKMNMIVEQVLMKEMQRWEHFKQGNKLYYILEPRSESGYTKALEDMLTEIIREFKTLSGESISAGISSPYEEYGKLCQAARECGIALEERCNTGDNSCIFYEDVKLTAHKNHIYNRDMMNTVISKMHALNQKEVVCLINGMFEELKKENALYPQFYGQTILLLVEIYNFAVASKHEVQKEVWRKIAALGDYKTADSLRKLVIKTVESVIPEVRQEKESKGRELITAIEDYVQQHIDKEISLQEIADAVHISKSYLCSIFKRECGETFFNYLTTSRINKAKELLKKTEHKVYVIAGMVGYQDYAYFAQVFKKCVGITAKEYREIYWGEI